MAQRNKRLSLENLPDVFIILKWMLILGMVFIVLLSLINLGNVNLAVVLYAIGNAMLIAGAFYGAGGLTGFLFGIPKIIQSNHVNATPENSRESDVIHNDNLVQISDWLTKIIVGVGLTQIYTIPKSLYHIGEKLGTSILGYDPGNSLGTNVSVAIILYFSILGFMMVYIWTRIYFYHILQQAKINFKSMYDETVEKLDNVISEKKVIEEEKQHSKTELDAIIKTFPDITQTIKAEQIRIKEDDKEENDPNKGKFGGLPENFGRKINAIVRETSYDKDLFVVDLEVVSTSPERPLAGTVIFHLHPSFPNDIEEVEVIDGKAECKLISYGAFTVGVEADEGNTKLELDLALLPDVPKLFKER